MTAKSLFTVALVIALAAVSGALWAFSTIYGWLWNGVP